MQEHFLLILTVSRSSCKAYKGRYKVTGNFPLMMQNTTVERNHDDNFEVPNKLGFSSDEPQDLPLIHSPNVWIKLS